MGELIDMSENLKHAEVLEAHELLLEGLNFSDTLNFSFTDSYDSMFDIVTDLGQTIV